MAVATSAPIGNADYILSRLSIANYFKTVLDSSHVTKGKPDPEVYLKASKAVGRKPESCIVFEDSVSGVKAGVAAGATVVGVTTTHSKEELSECSLTIADFKKIQLTRIIHQVPSNRDGQGGMEMGAETYQCTLSKPFAVQRSPRLYFVAII